jgi:pimeloyl-ACP methyl ester carboxylesterase
VTKILRTACILAPAALLAVALLVAPLGAAAPTEAPKTLELGKGPTIVIVHDLGGSRTSWMPTARKLIGTHRVVLVDLPGHGGSALPDPFTLDAAAEALDQVLAKQNPDSTVVVGKGTGGMLALLALKAHPGHARGIAVIDAGLKSPMPIEDQMIKYFQRQLDERYDDLMKMIYSRLGRDSVQGMTIHAMAMQVPPRTMKAYWGALPLADASPAVKSLQVPFLFIATDRLFKGGKSWGTVAREIGYEDTTTTRLRRLPGTGYLVMQDQPDSLAAVISAFTAQALAVKKK